MASDMGGAPTLSAETERELVEETERETFREAARQYEVEPPKSSAKLMKIKKLIRHFTIRRE